MNNNKMNNNKMNNNKMNNNKKIKKFNYKIKQSYGIICIRKNKITNNTEILLVKKTHTYAFSDFILGKYTKSNKEYLIKLFNQMSYNEKIIILSLKFNNIWYYLYHNNPETLYLNGNNQKWINNYIKKKNKFDLTFIKDGGIYLKKIIDNSISVDPLWDIPKGKTENNELPLDTAIRELKEETNIKLANMNILMHLKPFIESYIDGGSIYRNSYFYAEINNDWEPHNKFNLINYEISDIKWFDINKIIELYQSNYNFKINNIKKCIKHYKKYKKLNVLKY